MNSPGHASASSSATPIRGAALVGLCTDSIHKLMNERRLGDDSGWIRANCQEVSTLRQISENKFLDRELKRLAIQHRGQARDAGQGGQRSPSQGVLADHDGSDTTPRLQASVHRIRVVARLRIRVVRELRLKNDTNAGSWHVWTNNVLALLQLLLYTDVAVTRFPPRPQSQKTTTRPSSRVEWYSLRERPPATPRKLHEGETTAVQAVRNKLLMFGEQTLFLATTSGWGL